MKKLIAFTLLILLVHSSDVKADVPVGTVIAFTGSETKLQKLLEDDWMLCNGDSIPVKKYKDLHETIGNIYGITANPHYFYLPDFRGLFLRGVNGSRNDNFADPDTNRRTPHKNARPTNSQIGSIQADAIGNHQHSYSHAHILSAGVCESGRPHSAVNFEHRSNQTGTVVNDNASIETRPKNAYVYWIIKVR